jgi:GAF domain
MNLRSGMKFFAVVALFLNIGAAIILIGSLRNINPGNNLSLLSFFSFISIVVFSFFLFLVIILSRSDEPAKESSTESNTELIDEKKVSDGIASPELEINMESLRNKAANFIPKDARVPDEKYSLNIFAEETLSQIAKFYPIVEALFYLREKGKDEFVPIGEYAYYSEKKPSGFKLGETLPGQVAKNKRAMNISDIPDNYVKVASGLGKGSPRHLYFLPVIENEITIAIIEMASFIEFDKESEITFELAATELSKILVQLETKNL